MPGTRTSGPPNQRSGAGQYSVTSVLWIHRGDVSTCFAGGGGGGGQPAKASARAAVSSTERHLCSSGKARRGGGGRGRPICENRSVAALYRKYRPQTFAEVVGQEAVVRTL